MLFETVKEKLGLEERSRPLAGFFFIQELFLCHPSHGKKYESKLMIKYIAFQLLGLPLYCGMLGHLVMASSEEIMAERLETLADSIQTVVLLAVMFTYIHLGNRFMALYDRLYSDKFERPEKIAQAFYKCNKVVLLFFFLTCVLVPLFGFHNYYFNWFCDARKIMNDKRFICGLQLPCWYPFEINSDLLQKILIIWFVTFCTLALPHCAMLLLGLMSIPWYITLRIEHLKEQLDEILEVKLFQRKFRYIVEYYSEILECIEDMNNTCGYCLVFQFSLVALMIATLEYNIIIGGNHIETITFLIWFTMESLMCTIGQVMENQHEELVQSVRNLPWYDMSPELKKDYSLFLGKVQVPVKLRAQPLVDINYQFLLTVLHGTYSMLMFLLNNTK